MSRARSGGATAVLLALSTALVVAGCGADPQVEPDAAPSAPSSSAAASPSSAAATASPTSEPPTPSSSTDQPEPAGPPEPAEPAADLTLPNGTREVFARDDLLVAYYGTASTGSLGVLGESSPEVTDRRLRDAARPFRRPGVPVQRVYELIVTVADSIPGPDGVFSHDIPRASVQRWIDLAHEHGALLVLDLQPGRSDFLDVAKRWRWALEDPWVGLALDPEWRMGPRQVPGRQVGSVRAGEVDRVSGWLSRLVSRRGLPEKPFLLHQFKTSMVTDIGAITPREGLAMIQHVDGFGTPGQKLATYAAVARPRQFTMGFKLFYDEDVQRMGPAQVHRIRPEVRFVSFQ